jgi:hypothetical protein
MTTTVPVLRCEVTVTVIRAEGLATLGWRAKTQSPYVVVRAMQDLRPLCTTERTTAVRPQPMRAHPLPPSTPASPVYRAPSVCARGFLEGFVHR